MPLDAVCSYLSLITIYVLFRLFAFEQASRWIIQSGPSGKTTKTTRKLSASFSFPIRGDSVFSGSSRRPTSADHRCSRCWRSVNHRLHTHTQENTQNLTRTEESWDTLTGPEVDWKQSWEIRRTFGSNRWAETHPDVHWRARIQRKKSWDVFTMLTKWQCSKWFF